MPSLGFGKYAGMDLRDVPQEYLEWLIQMRKKDLAEYQGELERRELVESASITMVERVVQEGFRSLAKKFHPDAGGSDAEFVELKAAHEQLKMVLGEIKSVTGTSNNTH